MKMKILLNELFDSQELEKGIKSFENNMDIQRKILDQIKFQVDQFQLEKARAEKDKQTQIQQMAKERQLRLKQAANKAIQAKQGTGTVAKIQ